MVGPSGIASEVFISVFLDCGITFAKTALPSLNQLIGFPKFALRFRELTFLAVAFSISKTQRTTPVSVVFRNAIIVSSGDMVKFDKRAFSGSPDTCLSFFSLAFLTLRL